MMCEGPLDIELVKEVPACICAEHVAKVKNQDVLNKKHFFYYLGAVMRSYKRYRKIKKNTFGYLYLS